MKNIIIIPARLKSSRLNKKLLLKIDNKIILQHVFENCKKSKKVDEIYIATDSIEIKNECSKFTSNIIMTKDNHISGTDRIIEVIETKFTQSGNHNIINVQGDEPFINANLIDDLFIELEKENYNVVSVMHKINSFDELQNINNVKVVTNSKNEAIYFSRSIIPYPRDDINEFIKTNKLTFDYYKHVGIYGYKKEFLLLLKNMKNTLLSNIESLEQLKILENGYSIKMIESYDEFIGIDTQTDYENAKKYYKNINKG